MNVALILSGGTGKRVGIEIPKQYIEINGKRIITYCMEKLMLHQKIHAIQIVADKAWQDVIYEELDKIGINKRKFHGFSEPGRNRQLSIYHGLQDIQKYAEQDTAVFIHDAARPLLSNKQIENCLDALEGHDGVMPVLPMKDTIYKSIDGSSVSELLDRSHVFAGQAPEVFQLKKYYEANQKLLPEKILEINGSTEPAILNKMDVIMIDGDEKNFKITTKEDLERFREIIENQ